MYSEDLNASDLQKIANSVSLNRLAQDMSEFVDTLEKCLQCNRPIIDQEYAQYGFCSSRCEAEAERQIDEVQQDV